MLAATFFFALMNVMVKLVPDIPSVEVVFVRSVVSLVISYFFLKLKKVPIWGNNKKLLLLRGLSGAMALILYFYTLQEMPLATAVTIQMIAPIFTAILGVFMVKEKVSPFQWFCFLLSFSGIVMVHGFDERITPTLLIIGVLASFFSGLAFNFIRMINISERPMVIVFYFPLVTLPLTGMYSLFDWVPPGGYEWLILILIGVVVQIAQFLMTRAYQLEEISKIASINYIGVLYALAFGWLLFEEHFNLQTYLGMILVLFGVVANLFYKQWFSRERTS